MLLSYLLKVIITKDTSITQFNNILIIIVAFKNMVLRKTQEVRVDWKKLQNQELHNLYSQPNINHVIKQLRPK